jgi:Xaa-Pro dipeptidase
MLCISTYTGNGNLSVDFQQDDAIMEHIPASELDLRQRRGLDTLARQLPDAEGLMLFGRVNIYYFTGVMGSGILWLPREGKPLLLTRKGAERAKLDNPDLDVAEYRSYTELEQLCADRGRPLCGEIAVEKNALNWTLAENLCKRLERVRFVAADSLLAQLRAVKSPFELGIMREAGARHAKALEDLLPTVVYPGMSELEVAHRLSDVCYSLGGVGLSRMSAFGEEMLLGEVSVGENGNYPIFYNGPLGCRGAHPSAPFLGSGQYLWREGSILTVDAGFCLEGYNSDKTLCFFAGPESDIPSIARKAQQCCLDIEAATSAAMHPGAIPRLLYEEALRMADAAGFAAGFMGLGGNKVPFLGHGIGLCIDEWPVLAARFDKPLQAGMTLAVEPKIGLRGIGMVGSENTYEITESGGVCLSGRRRQILCFG